LVKTLIFLFLDSQTLMPKFNPINKVDSCWSRRSWSVKVTRLWSWALLDHRKEKGRKIIEKQRNSIQFN